MVTLSAAYSTAVDHSPSKLHCKTKVDSCLDPT